MAQMEEVSLFCYGLELHFLECWPFWIWSCFLDTLKHTDSVPYARQGISMHAFRPSGEVSLVSLNPIPHESNNNPSVSGQLLILKILHDLTLL